MVLAIATISFTVVYSASKLSAILSLSFCHCISY